MSLTPAKSVKPEIINCETTPRCSIHYVIFMYREELRKRGDDHFMQLSEAKLFLTDNLISNTIRNISKYDVEEITYNIKTQISFKKRLYNKIDKIKNLEKLGVKNIDPKQISDDI